MVSLSRPIRTDICPIAQRYHRRIALAAQRKKQHQANFEAHRGVYDDFYDRLAHLSPEHRDDEYAQAHQVVTAIEKNAETLSQEAHLIAQTLDSALIDKTIAVATQSRQTSDNPVQRFITDFEAIRCWRIADLDGIDVDFVSLLHRGLPRKGPRAPLFDRMYRIWCKMLGIDPEAFYRTVIQHAKTN